MVAGRDPGDGRADRLDDPGALVAEDTGQREGQPAARHAEVGVTQAGRHQPDEGLVRGGVVQDDVGEGEGRAAGLDDGGAGGDGHRAYSWGAALSRARRRRT
ncbi:hypothetical protein ALMP_03410 [Streptomyces sp. A012304]|nr:hypothetical protein ALMP_03410 [Streptomyces sp. A012304]